MGLASILDVLCKVETKSMFCSFMINPMISSKIDSRIDPELMERKLKMLRTMRS